MMREWLESHGLGRYTTLFEENEVDFEIPRALTENDLADLGLGFGPRRKLVNALIKMKAAPSLAADATGPGRSTQSDASVGGARSIADGERRQLTERNRGMDEAEQSYREDDKENIRSVFVR